MSEISDGELFDEAEVEAAARGEEVLQQGAPRPPSPGLDSLVSGASNGGRRSARSDGGPEFFGTADRFEHSFQNPAAGLQRRQRLMGGQTAGSASASAGPSNGPGGGGGLGVAGVAPSPTSGRGHANQRDLGGRGGHLHGMDEYRDIPQLMKVEVPVTPVFPHGVESNGGWLDYRTAMGQRVMRPVRAMCFNIPVDLFSTDAYRFKHIATNLDNPTRATNICALFGLLWTGVSKGWQSGDHAELHRANDLQDEDDADKKKTQKEETFSRYMYVDHETGVELPMFVCGYEELYDQERSRVVAIRVWKFVFDGTHSDSKLVDRLMRENQDRLFHAGAAHCSNSKRSSRLVQEHERTAKLVGNASPSEVALEYHAGNQYMRCCTLPDYKTLLPSYGGRTDTNPLGAPPIDVADLPDGTLNARLREATNGEGGQSPLSPEFVFNAKRPDALGAGLVHFNGTPIEVCAAQLDPSSYFDMAHGGTHDFRPPPWLTATCGLWLQTDPYQRNPFDMALPRSHASGERPGPTLLATFAERVLKNPDEAKRPTIVDKFRGMMKDTDQATERLLQQTADAIFTFDTTTCNETQRKAIMMAKSIARKGMAASLDGKDTVIRSRKVLDEIKEQTARIHDKLIAPFIHEERKKYADGVEELEKEAAAEAAGTRPAPEAAASSDAPFERPETPEQATLRRAETLATLKIKRDNAEEKYVLMKQELFELHVEREKRAFNSRVDKATIPQGYRACYDGLMKELEAMPNKSANIAQGLPGGGVQLTDAQRTPFGHMINWLGSWWEDECFVDGRDWRRTRRQCPLPLPRALSCCPAARSDATDLPALFRTIHRADAAPRALRAQGQRQDAAP